MENKRNTYLAGIAVLCVLIVYIFFITIGPWRARGYTSDYYSRLATSFRHGQLALEEQPDPALLALTNPYDHKARKNVPVVGDASLYKEKYYLYFGPFPSVVLALITSVLPAEPGDPIFVNLFMVGLFLTQCLLFWEIMRQFFADLPGWILPVGILLLGVTGPFTRMLAHPFIHEAAIAAGQFFFTAGFTAAFLALKTKPISQGRLFLAGLLWAFTIATRTTQLVPVAFMVALTWLYVLKDSRGTVPGPDLGKYTLALVSPLAICGLILAWYNWARFDSIFEFGFYYQLAAFNLQANYSILFSRIYIIQNLYNYFLNPFEFIGTFPFANPLPGTEKPVLSTYELPNLYAVEGRFPGALISTPFLIFSILPPALLVIKYIRSIWTGIKKAELFNHLDWTVLGLLGSAIAGAIPTLLLFYVGFRYETEFIASLTMLSLVGLCQGYRLTSKSALHGVYIFVAVSLALLSILLNLALAYTGTIDLAG